MQQLFWAHRRRRRLEENVPKDHRLWSCTAGVIYLDRLSIRYNLTIATPQKFGWVLGGHIALIYGILVLWQALLGVHQTFLTPYSL